MVNPHAANPCDLAHIPDDVAEHVGNFVKDGPDEGWDRARWDPSTFFTGLWPGDLGPATAAEVQLTTAQLDAALRAQG